MTRKQLIEFLYRQENFAHKNIADALIKEGFVVVDKPKEHWSIFDEDVRTNLCVCFSLEEATKYQPRYKERTKIYHCVEVEND